MTTWTLTSDEVTVRHVTVALAAAPTIRTAKVTLAPVEACWTVCPWGEGTRIGNVLVSGEIVAGEGSQSGGTMIVGYTMETQPGWLADIMAEAVHG